MAFLSGMECGDWTICECPGGFDLLSWIGWKTHVADAIQSRADPQRAVLMKVLRTHGKGGGEAIST